MRRFIGPHPAMFSLFPASALRWGLFFVLVLFAPLAFAGSEGSPAPAGELRYVFDYTEESAQLVLEATWTPAAPGSHTDFLLCGGGWGGIRNCEASLSGLEVAGKPLSEPLPRSPWRTAQQGGKATLRLRFAPSSPPSSAPDVFRRPMITADWLYLVGHTTFPIPRNLSKNDRVRVVVDARALSKRFGHVSLSWLPGAAQAIRVVGPEEIGAVVITAGGQVSGLTESTGLSGFSLTEVRLSEDGLPTHLEAQTLELLKGYFSYYGRSAVRQSLVLVPVASAPGQGPAINGIVLPGVISLMLPQAADWRDPALRRAAAHFLAHELGHIWIGQTLRAGSREAELAWFIEGFTNHVARTVLYRSGVFSLDDYLWSLNQTLVHHQDNPKRNLNNRDLARQWPGSQGYLHMTPYLRGDLVALWLNQRLSAVTDAPDLRELLQRLLAEPTMHDLDPERLIGHLTGPLSEADRRLFKEMVLEGKAIPLELDHLAPCLVPAQASPRILYEIAPGGAAACPGLL